MVVSFPCLPGRQWDLCLVDRPYLCSSQDASNGSQYVPDQTPDTCWCPCLLRLHVKVLCPTSAECLAGWDLRLNELLTKYLSKNSRLCWSGNLHAARGRSDVLNVIFTARYFMFRVRECGPKSRVHWILLLENAKIMIRSCWLKNVKLDWKKIVNCVQQWEVDTVFNVFGSVLRFSFLLRCSFL